MHIVDRSGLDSDESLREHLRQYHGWTALDVFTRWNRARTMHRFEHFEESVGLVELEHDHSARHRLPDDLGSPAAELIPQPVIKDPETDADMAPPGDSATVGAEFPAALNRCRGPDCRAPALHARYVDVLDKSRGL
jgi:hypothetical protein